MFSIVTNASSAGAADLTSKTRLGEGMGFLGLGTNLGMSVGPATGFYLINRFNFSAVFWGSAVLGLVALLIIKLSGCRSWAGKLMRPHRRCGSRPRPGRLP